MERELQEVMDCLLGGGSSGASAAAAGGEEKELTNTALRLNKEATKKALASFAKELDNIIPTLTPEAHTLQITHILLAQGGNKKKIDEIQWLHNVELIAAQGVPAHFQQDRAAVAKLASQYADSLVKMNQPARGILPLHTLLQKVQRNTEHLTGVHDTLLKLCLLAKQYTFAKKIVEADVLQIHSGNSREKDVDVERVLSYYYYSGMVFIGLKNYLEAIRAFSIVLSAPAEAPSAIALAAYKKYVLVSLIHAGKVVAVPKYISGFVIRALDSLSSPYQELARAHGTSKIERLNEVITKSSVDFTSDRNFGLVLQVREKLYRQNIKKLTETFITLSLTDIARRVDLATPQEAEEYLVKMIADGEIFASINQVSGMVSFHDDPEQYDTNATSHVLMARLDMSARVLAKVKEFDTRLRLDEQYNKRISGQTDAPNPSAQMDLDFHDGVELDG